MRKASVLEKRNQGGLLGRSAVGAKTQITKRIQQWKIRGKSILGRENSKGKGSEAGTSLAGLKTQKKAYEVGS